MKTILALLASTSICYAASVGVSKEQLRASGIHTPEASTTPSATEPPSLWSLVAQFHYDDGSETGVEVSRTIHEFTNQMQCEAVRDEHKDAAKASKVTLECRQEE